MAKANLKDRSMKVRLILAFIILILDVIFVPFIVNYAITVFTKGVLNAEINFLSKGVLYIYKSVFTESKNTLLFLILQLPVLVVFLSVIWNPHQLPNRKSDMNDVGTPEASGNGEHGTSRWMSQSEKNVESATWITDKPLKKGGLLFGTDFSNGTEKMYFSDDDEHSLLLATTRIGKSRKIYLPTIWQLAKAGESMVISDPKGELYIYTKDYLKEQGYKIITLNLSEPSKGNRWNMLDLVNRYIDEGDVSKATEIAWDIASAIAKQSPSTSGEPIWQNGAESTIASLALLASMESQFPFQRHMTTAYYLLAEYGQANEDGTIPLNDYFKTLPATHPAKSAFATASIAPQKTRASFFTTVLSYLRLFSDSNIADMTSVQDHVLEDIGIEKTAVFLIIPDEKSTRNVLATLYIDQVYSSLVNLARKKGGRIPRRVNLLLDEFGNLPAIPEFDKKITVAGGRGIRINIAIQDFAQLKKLYDKNAPTIMGNCHNWIYILSSDTETCKMISERVGKYTIQAENLSNNLQNKGSSIGLSAGVTGRQLLTPDEVGRWDKNYSLVMRIGKFPAKYPIPDLSNYKANIDFGFVSSDNLDADKEANRVLIEKRWAEIIPRKIEQPRIWLPDLYEPQSTEDDDTHVVHPSPSNEPSANEIKPVTIDMSDINIDEIIERDFGNVDNSDDDDGGDFLNS